VGRAPRENPYTKFSGRDLTLNDHLAIDRTILSNERTLLAYGRTALALVIVGGSCIKFFDSPWMTGTGVLFVVSAGVVAVRGWQRYEQMRAYTAAALDVQTGTTAHPLEKAVDERRKKEESATDTAEP
jgi:putative membrane protein